MASEAEAERAVRDGLTRIPSSADVHDALFLSLTRSHRGKDAGQLATARQHDARLAQAYPKDREAQALVESLRGRSPY
jgi:hypothetical protein